MPDRFAATPAEEEITLELRDHSLANAEATLIHKVLEETDWNLKRAARKLDIARGTLYSKMKRYDIRRPDMHVFP